jgi:transposase InsO family protein
MCRLYDVSRFGYYSWKARGQSKRSQRDMELTSHIERLFNSVDGIYGSPKIHQLMQQEGLQAGLNRVARLMREQGLKARCARIYRSHAQMDRFYASIRAADLRR